jgi:putative hydrolase of the HAD superfamily
MQGKPCNDRESAASTTTIANWGELRVAHVSRPRIGSKTQIEASDHSVRQYLIWDFDGTLGYRDGNWDGALVEVLQRADPACPVRREQIVPHLQTGYPWHDPGTTYPSGRSSDMWWQSLEPVFRRAFVAVGVPAERAIGLAAEVRDVFTCPDRWCLYDDALVALEELSRNGWTHIILSNHVPELSLILEHLGVLRLVDRVFNSAETGFEKPHPQAFSNVLASLEHGAAVWMIGDNLRVDIQGATAASIPAILVRQQSALFTNQCEDLKGIGPIIYARGHS